MLTLFGHRAPEIVLNYIRQCVADNIWDYVVSDVVRIVNLGLINVFYPRDVKKIVPNEIYKELLTKWEENAKLKGISLCRKALLEKHEILTKKVKKLPKRANGNELVQKIMNTLKDINKRYVRCKKSRQNIIKGVAKCQERIRRGDKTVDNTGVVIDSVFKIFKLYEDSLKYGRCLAKKCSMKLFGTLHQVNKDEVLARLESAKKRLYHPFKTINTTENSDWCPNIKDYLDKSGVFMDELENIIGQSMNTNREDQQEDPQDKIIQNFECLIENGRAEISQILKRDVQQVAVIPDAFQGAENVVKSIKGSLDNIKNDKTDEMERCVLVLGAAQEIYESIYKAFDAIDVTIQNLLRTKELTADTIAMVFYAISVFFASLAVIGTFSGVALFAALPLVKMITSVLSVGSTAVAIGYKYWHNYGVPAWVSNIVSKAKNRLCR